MQASCHLIDKHLKSTDIFKLLIVPQLHCQMTVTTDDITDDITDLCTVNGWKISQMLPTNES